MTTNNPDRPPTEEVATLAARAGYWRGYLGAISNHFPADQWDRELTDGVTLTVSQCGELADVAAQVDRLLSREKRLAAFARQAVRDYNGTADKLERSAISELDRALRELGLAVDNGHSPAHAEEAGNGE